LINRYVFGKNYFTLLNGQNAIPVKIPALTIARSLTVSCLSRVESTEVEQIINENLHSLFVYLSRLNLVKLLYLYSVIAV